MYNIIVFPHDHTPRGDWIPCFGSYNEINEFDVGWGQFWTTLWDTGFLKILRKIQRTSFDVF